jgi:hypothetical protein
VQKGVIERRPDGLFDQDVSRWKYLTHLRERKSSPRATADAEFAKAKTEWLALRIAKHKREHVLASEADAVLEGGRHYAQAHSLDPGASLSDGPGRAPPRRSCHTPGQAGHSR